ncbi:MAG: 50S ribosomal protein L22, partial [Eubacterium sp.]|nr:50S ribosomal protein L22 [Eubacterium sp.]
MITESKAVAKYVRISPRKVQIVLDLIRNQPADKAMAILKFTPKAACEPVTKVLKSAMANAENNYNMD